MTHLNGLEIANMNVHYFRYPFSCFLEEQDSLGFGSFIFWGSVPHIWVDQFGHENIDELIKMIRSRSVKLSAYAARPYNYSLFAPKGSLQRKCSADYYRLCIDIAQRLGTNRMCIDLWGALRDGSPNQQYDDCIEMLADLCAYAKQRGCSVVVGNVPIGNSALMNTLVEVKCLKKDVAMDNCEIALDVCTALENGERIVDWLDAFSTTLSVIYLADGRNTGAGYPLGHGCYPISKILRFLKKREYSGMIAIKLDREKSELNPTLADRNNISYLGKYLS